MRSGAGLTVPVLLRSVRMVRPFGDELVAVDAAAVVIVVIVVTAAQVLAFYKALEHEHEAVQTVAPSLETGVLGRSRTGDLPLRRRLLYPLSYGDLREI